MPVGYLFTDIEGSTERWERVPARMEGAVAHHNSLIDAVVAAHGGVIHDRAGDGVFAVFPTGNPVQCALAIQLALQDVDWSAVDGLWVRIGVHIGRGREGALIDRAAVNRAARIMACGWGGQIIASAEAVAAFPANAETLLRDFGVCHLRGIDEPVRLFGIVHPGLKRSEFPPLRALAGNGQSVPAPTAPLFGREDTLRDIREKMETASLVTIVGPAGNGKTRLAIEIAAVASAQRPAYFVPLEGAVDEFSLLSRVAVALHFPFYGATSREDQLVDYLGDKSALLVLDNADLAAAASPFLSKLITRCAHLDVLATSRGPLGIPGETVHRLVGVSWGGSDGADIRRSPACKLFVREALAVNPQFQLEDTHLETFREICKALGGSPLGLQLVAPWTRLLSLDAILERLQAGLDFLETPDREARGPPGLRTVFEGSWILLDRAPQEALARLSVFAGDFDATAAAAVAEVDVALIDVLERRGLVEQTGRHRFKLHPIVREYARQKLATDHEQEARTSQRHGAYYLEMLCDGLATPGETAQGDALDRIEANIDNLTAAWVFTLAHGPRALVLKAVEPFFYFLALRALFREGVVLFSAQPGDAGLRPYLLGLLANCLVHLGDQEGAAAAADKALKSKTRNPLARAHALHARGTIAHVQGAYAVARQNYEAALALREGMGDLMGCSYTAISLAALHLLRDDTAEARRWVREAYRINRQIRNTTGMMLATFLAGDIALRDARVEDARENYEAALRIEKSVRNLQYRSGALFRLGGVVASQGETARAHDIFLEAFEAATDVGDKRMQARALLELGANARARGDLPHARSYLLDGVRRALALEARPLLSRGLVELVRVEADSGDMDGARRLAGVLTSAVLASADRDTLEDDLGSLLGQHGEVLPDNSASLRELVEHILSDAEIRALRL